jgi:lysophospholipase L1-like esterase
MLTRRNLLSRSWALPLLGSLTSANATETPCAPSSQEIQRQNDWPNLARYQLANEQLRASKQKVDVVFMGDSITEGWYGKRPDFFRAGFVGRGIGGQTTPQMVLRFRQDVIDLQPRAIHLMAATNDIAGNTGPMTPEMTQANFMSMAELAHQHHIKVIVASIPPAARFPWKPEVETVPAIALLNIWLKRYAHDTHCVVADYIAVLDDGSGAMRAGLAYDGVHPTEAGYDTMAPVALAAIRKALR